MRVIALALSLISLTATVAVGPAARSQNLPATTDSKSQNEAGLTDKEKALLQRIRAMKTPRWRSFGACRYDWSSWRLSANGDGVRTTSAECGEPPVTETVAVHCGTFKVSRRSGQEAWSPWRLPQSLEESKTSGGEDLMVAALCANAPLTPPPVAAKANAAKPATTKSATPKPAPAKP